MNMPPSIPTSPRPAADEVQAEVGRAAAFALAVLPAVSFVGQYLCSVRAGTLPILLRHPTVMVVDWLFVPFNYFVLRVIDWRRGFRLYVIAGISILLNTLTHAYWQYEHVDPGHMITPSGVVLPAGWIHLAFSTIETILLIAFVFCRKPNAGGLRASTALAAAYFVVMALSGYSIHHAFNLSDVIVSSSGLFFVLVYPRLTSRAG